MGKKPLFYEKGPDVVQTSQVHLSNITKGKTDCKYFYCSLIDSSVSLEID